MMKAGNGLKAQSYFYFLNNLTFLKTKKGVMDGKGFILFYFYVHRSVLGVSAVSFYSLKHFSKLLKAETAVNTQILHLRDESAFPDWAIMIGWMNEKPVPPLLSWRVC